MTTTLTAEDRTESGRRTIQLFLLDDHAVVREGLRRVFEGADGFEIVGEAGSAAAGLQAILDTEPDVALVDVRLGGADGIEVIRAFRNSKPHIQAVVLTSFTDETAFFQAVVAGAVDYLLKDAHPDELVATCRQAAAGGSLLGPHALDDLRARAQRLPQDDLLADLTPRERRILQHVTQGLTNGEIAEQLHLAEKTVRNYVSNVLTKLGMKNRTQAAVYVARATTRRSGGAAPPDRGPGSAASQRALREGGTGSLSDAGA